MAQRTRPNHRAVSAFEVTPDGAGVYFLVRDFGSGSSRSFVGYAEFSNPSQAVVLGQTDGAQPPGVESFSVDSTGERVVYVISEYDTASQTYSRRVEVAERAQPSARRVISPSSRRRWLRRWC